MCSAVVVLVEVSLLKQTRTRRVNQPSDNIVFEDLRGAQVVYTGDPGILLSTAMLCGPRTLILLWDRAHVILARPANPHSQLTPCMIAPISTLPLIPFIGSAVTIQIKLVITCI